MVLMIIIIIIITSLFQEGNTISTKLIALAALKSLQVCTNRQVVQEKRKKKGKELCIHIHVNYTRMLITQIHINYAHILITRMPRYTQQNGKPMHILAHTVIYIPKLENKPTHQYPLSHTYPNAPKQNK